MDTGGKLKVLTTGGNLHLYNVNCFGVINSGDSVNFTTTYALTPKQVITSP
jgi:protein involved in ribonucleotide reduction